MTQTMNHDVSPPAIHQRGHLAVADRAIALLTDLVALPTVNPMGRPYEGALPVERPVIEYLEQVFAPYGVQTERQSCSPIHESLLITVPGRGDAPGTLFESHIDTVPADDWPDRAFMPRVEGTKIYGRGACDDKGSLAAMVLALLELLESGTQPQSTILLLAAGDEEYGQTGIKHFVAHHDAPLGCAVVGEPTGCLPVIQHKGVIRWDITVHGRSAHTSQPENGRSAILDMIRVIDELSQHQEQLRRRHANPLLTGPSLTVTTIHGGRTRNAVPDECTIAVDFRILPEMDGRQAIDELVESLARLDIPLTHGDFQCFIPGLNTSPVHPFVNKVAAVCRKELGCEVAPIGAPYGSDACLLPAGVPAVVLGPGDIAQAHAVDEYVDVEQVRHCAAIYQRIVQQVQTER